MKFSRNSMVFSIFLILGDAFAILAAYVLAYILRVKLSAIPTYEFVSAREYFLSLLILLPFIILLFSLIGTYQAKRQKKLARAGRIFVGAFLAMLFMIFIDYFANSPIFPAKLVPLYGFLFSIILLAIIRGILYFSRWFFRRRGIKQNVILIGDGKSAKFREILSAILSENSGLNLMATISGKKSAPKNYKTFTGATKNFTPDIILQIATREKPALDAEILTFAEKNFVDFKFVPREFGDLAEDVNPELFLGEILVMSVQPTKLTGWGRVAKRVLDLFVSTIFLLVFSWLYLLIFLAEKFSGGMKSRAIFSQIRLTRGDKKFKVYKFRTQFQKFDGTTPEEAFAKIGKPELAKKYRANGDFLPNDPRITKLGKFLRKTSLDELPQMWNVWRGDISLVGPRALIPQELNNFAKKHQILNVKSGLTGLAVVSGRRNLPWDERRKLDVFYVQNWSFGLDILILFKTFWQIVSRRGAE